MTGNNISDERLQRASAALDAYGAGMRELGRVATEALAPIRARGAGELTDEDKAVINVVTKIVDAIGETLDNVRKALHE